MNVAPGGAALYRMELRLRWDPAFKAEQVRGETVAALKDVGETWHRDKAPGHFQISAMNKYNYKTRTQLYLKRKAREKGHQRPLVWTGRFEAAVKAAKTMRFTGKSRIRMRLSVWGGWPQVREELFRTTTDENAEMVMAIRERLIKFMKAPTSATPQPPAAVAGSAAG